MSAGVAGPKWVPQSVLAPALAVGHAAEAVTVCCVAVVAVATAAVIVAVAEVVKIVIVLAWSRTVAAPFAVTTGTSHSAVPCVGVGGLVVAEWRR